MKYTANIQLSSQWQDIAQSGFFYTRPQKLTPGSIAVLHCDNASLFIRVTKVNTSIIDKEKTVNRFEFIN
ncbi:hypothetical protein RHO15_05940 [Utexia brackfieldae]|uniref:hypothetical protein n=1 Tax=Utexia brackfieldae TaxID=3074108 RepID=UPI00370DBB73